MTTMHLQRLQPYWDWRAAGNFVCGGAGAGLLAFTAVCAPATMATTVLMIAGLALVALGLTLVWLEIGRPLRALNVFVQLRRSWMSREALSAVVLFALGLGVLVGLRWGGWPIALAALAFLYCQARILGAALAIPAWREPLTVPLMVLTGLAEGAGLFWLLAAWQHPPLVLAAPLGALVVLRWVLWSAWRARLRRHAPAAALQAIAANAPAIQWIGGVLPLALVGLGVTGIAGAAGSAALIAAAGAAAAAGGALFKHCLITRAAFHHGISLPRMPVRGVPRSAA